MLFFFFKPNTIYWFMSYVFKRKQIILVDESYFWNLNVLMLQENFFCLFQFSYQVKWQRSIWGSSVKGLLKIISQNSENILGTFCAHGGNVNGQEVLSVLYVSGVDLISGSLSEPERQQSLHRRCNAIALPSHHVKLK